MDDKSREVKMRRQATRLGLILRKSRARRWSLINHLGYTIEDDGSNTTITSEKYDLTLDDVEIFLKDYEKKQRGI
jgi:hypothetical protein